MNIEDNKLKSYPNPDKIASYFPANNKRYEVIFYGGEAFLYFDYMIEIARALKSRNPNIQLVVTTNGSLLSPQRSEILNELDFRVNISHDGPVYEITRRRPDILKTHTDAICQLNNSVFVSTVTTLNWNYYDIWNHFENFCQSNNIPRRKVNMMFLKDTDGTTPEELFIYNHKDFENMLIKVHNNLKTDILTGVTDSYEFMAYKNTLGRLLKEELFHNSKTLCMHFDTSMVLDIYGNIYNCHNGRSPVGHITNDNLPDIKNDKIVTEPCVSCTLKNYCCGGCFNSTGDRWKYTCYYIKHDFGGVLRILNEIITELNTQNKDG